MKISNILFILFTMLLAPPAFSDVSNDLTELLSEALAHNFEVKSYAENSRAEKKMITSKYNFSDPSVGISRLNRGNQTEYLTIQQKIRFPTKYYLAGKSQRKTFESSVKMLEAVKLEVRKNLIEVYFSLYAVQKTIQLTKTNLQLVKDFARIAEKKYAAGKSSQSDSMKSHFEMTQLELNILNLEQEESILQSRMNSLLGRPLTTKLNLGSLNLESPKIYLGKIKNQDVDINQQILKTSPMILSQQKKYEAAKIKHSLAKWGFAPDFTVQYQKRISGFPEDSNIISLNMTIPLWFWKNSAEASHASAKAMIEDYKQKDLSLKFVENLKSLKIRLKKSNKALTIYKTTLMPQAEGAYRTSRSAYKAGTATFLNLLDAERSLYTVKQAYYKTLTHYVKDIVEAETILGISISNLQGITRTAK